MRIYIMTDQEGVAGVTNSKDFSAPGARYYEIARELLTLEVNAAIEGALEGGAKEFLVVDGHGPGSINVQLLHPKAKLLAGRPIGYPFGCGADFDVAFSIGQHAKANTNGGHLCHTGSFHQEELLINGLSMGEMGCNFLVAAYYGVPYVFLSGDQAATEEARELVPNIVVAPIKEGLKRGSALGLTVDQNREFNGAAVHLQPERARDVIRQAAAQAVRAAKSIEPFWLEPPYELVSILRPEAKDGPWRSAVCRGNDLLELLQMPRHHVADEAAERYLTR